MEKRLRKWIPAKEQALNRGNTRSITYMGETHCIGEWGRILHIEDNSILARVYKGMTIDEAISMPIKKTKKRCLPDSCHGAN